MTETVSSRLLARIQREKDAAEEQARLVREMQAARLQYLQRLFDPYIEGNINMFRRCLYEWADLGSKGMFKPLHHNVVYQTSGLDFRVYLPNVIGNTEVEIPSYATLIDWIQAHPAWVALTNELGPNVTIGCLNGKLIASAESV